MPQFVIEREIAGASKLTDAKIQETSLSSLRALKELGREIRWVHSFVTDDKIYCIYFAPDEAMIRKHGEISGIRVDRVSAVRRLVDPAAYA